ncbi:hypothetical protein OAF09_00450 [bacterium]|nr:hypothetical protein [bacterium]
MNSGRQMGTCANNHVRSWVACLNWRLPELAMDELAMDELAMDEIAIELKCRRESKYLPSAKKFYSIKLLSLLHFD